MITLRELLADPDLRLKLVAGGAREGAGRTIRAVHVSELADPTPWLQGGEFLLTTGLPLKRGTTAQRAYIRTLADAGLAGLGLGVGFSYRHIPSAVLEEAEASGFPVVEVPYDVPFIAITEAAIRESVAHQTRLLRRSMSLLQTLIAFVHEGRGLPAMVEAIASRIGGWVILCRPQGAVLATAGTVPDDLTGVVAASLAEGGTTLEGDDDDLGAGAAVETGFGPVGRHPIEVAGRIEAVVLLGGKRRSGEYESLVAGHGTTILALELAKQAAVAETEQRLADDLVRLALSGAPDADIASRLAGFDLDVEAGIVVAVIDGLAVRETRILAGPLLNADRPALAAAAGDDTVVVVETSSTGGEPGVVARELAERLAEVTGRRIGLGSAGSLRQSIAEARYALQALPAPAVASLGDVGTYRLLLGLAEPGALGSFAAGVLGDLLEYDRTHHTDLIPSLEAFLDHNGHWESAARGLGIHRHTLRYRIRKIEELTGKTLDSADDRTELHLALKAQEMSEAGR